MIREIIKIDESLCDGCGLCVPNCHEGALQVIDGKVRLVSDLVCDGLGACLGHCPQGALAIERREAEPYDEVATLREMLSSGKNTVVAHLLHLKDHNELDLLQQGLQFLKENVAIVPFSIDDIDTIINPQKTQTMKHLHAEHAGGGCPGSRSMSFTPSAVQVDVSTIEVASQLTHWPVQLHLINPAASFFKNADMLFAADCVAFSLADFHQKYLKGKTLAIACPKLDDGQTIYFEKVVRLIDEANVNTITVMIMEVPCCGGLLSLIQKAAAQASRKVPVKAVIVSTRGKIISENWV